MNQKVTTEHNKGNATIFKNSFLESLTKTTLISNIIVYGTVVILLIYNALYIENIEFTTFISLFTFALFFWTFAEYILHRFVFHWINKNKFVQRQNRTKRNKIPCKRLIIQSQKPKDQN